MSVDIAKEKFLASYHITKQDLDNFIFLSKVILEDLNLLIDNYYEVLLSSTRNFYFIKEIENPTAQDILLMKERDYHHWTKFLKGEFDSAYLEDRKAVGNRMATYQIPSANYTHIISLLGDIVLEHLANKNLVTLNNWHSFKKLLNIDCNLIIEEYIHYTNNIMIEHNNVLQKMSLPISKILEDVLYIPVIGNISDENSQSIIDRVIQEIAKTACKIVILDIIGVPNLTHTNAQDIARLYKGCSLMGCNFIICGVSPESAQIMSQINSLNDKELFSTTSMIQALEHALALRNKH